MATVRIADLHCDTVLRILKGIDISHPGSGHVDLPGLRAGGVRLQAFAAYVDSTVEAERALDTAMSMIDAVESMCRDHATELEIVTEAGSAVRAADGDRTAVLLTVENGHALGDEPSNLEALRRRGVRALTLVHAKNLSWIASCTDEARELDGVTPLGLSIVDAMCDLGIIVDISHAHAQAFWKIARHMNHTGLPLIASHSNAWEVCHHARNLTDDQIRQVADTGGVVGVNFCPPFLNDAYREAWYSGDKAALERTSVTASTVADHIDHIVNVAGEGCVAFGSDFDGITTTPEDIRGSSDYTVILRELRGRGYSSESLEKFAWHNVIRVLQAWD